MIGNDPSKKRSFLPPLMRTVEAVIARRVQIPSPRPILGSAVGADDLVMATMAFESQGSQI